jgi:hypothetical protein
LEAAELQTDDLRGRVQAGARWDSEEMEDLGKAQSHLLGANEVIGELKSRTVGTPYAFVGLQVHEIGFSHITPAQENLAKAGTIEGDERQRYTELDEALLHIRRARDMLKDLEGKFEAVKAEEQLETAMKHLSEMHQVFVEDMQALLKNSKPTLNPREGEIDEVDEETVKAIEEYYEQLKKLMDELAKVLADNPELLRRFLAAMRMDAYTIRDQLTLLSMRQKEEAEILGQWNGAKDAEGRGAVLETARERLAEELESIARDAELMSDNMTTWLPLDADKEDPDVQDALSKGGQTASRSRDAARSMRERDLGKVRDELMESANIHEGLQDTLTAVRSKPDDTGRMALYAANRSGEAQEIAISQQEWLEKLDAVEEGRFERANQVSQYRLALDTVDYGVKLDRLVPMVQRLSQEIGEKARNLEKTVSTDVVDHQVAACMALQDRDGREARNEQGEALEDFDRAEDTFDELLTLIEAQMPPAGGGGGSPPSVEEILAMLEDECKACEKLGAACRKVNVMVQMDWMMPGSGTGMGTGGSSGTGNGGQGNSNQQGQSSRPNAQQTTQQAAQRAMQQAMQRMMEAQMRAAQNHAQRAADQMREASRQAGQNARNASRVAGQTTPPEGTKKYLMPPEGYDLREWDTLVSDLEKEMRTTRGNEPPREYEAAIDAYFRTLADLLSETEGEANSE